MPGVRRWFGGDRTLDEQLKGLDAALDECRGKTVLDIGCAEGEIAFEFARRGARHVRGLELVHDHIKVAVRVCTALGLANRVTFQNDDVGRATPAKQYDIVLALGVAHKLMRPEVCIQFAARSAKSLVVIRMSAETKDGMLHSKHHHRLACDVNKEMGKFGFKLEKVTDGPRGEPVHYYRC